MHTDYNSLTYIKNSSKVNATCRCWIIKLANFNSSIHYKPGAWNVVTDALSHFPTENKSAKTNTVTHVTLLNLNQYLMALLTSKMIVKHG